MVGFEHRPICLKLALCPLAAAPLTAQQCVYRFWARLYKNIKCPYTFLNIFIQGVTIVAITLSEKISSYQGRSQNAKPVGHPCSCTNYCLLTYWVGYKFAVSEGPNASQPVSTVVPVTQFRFITRLINPGLKQWESFINLLNL